LLQLQEAITSVATLALVAFRHPCSGLGVQNKHVRVTAAQHKHHEHVGAFGQRRSRIVTMAMVHPGRTDGGGRVSLSGHTPSAATALRHLGDTKTITLVHTCCHWMQLLHPQVAVDSSMRQLQAELLPFMAHRGVTARVQWSTAHSAPRATQSRMKSPERNKLGAAALWFNAQNARLPSHQHQPPDTSNTCHTSSCRTDVSPLKTYEGHASAAGCSLNSPPQHLPPHPLQQPHGTPGIAYEHHRGYAWTYKLPALPAGPKHSVCALLAVTKTSSMSLLLPASALHSLAWYNYTCRALCWPWKPAAACSPKSPPSPAQPQPAHAGVGS
jgi:hypothetical protein